MLTENSAAIERSVSPSTTVRTSGWSGAPAGEAAFSVASASVTTSPSISVSASPVPISTTAPGPASTPLEPLTSTVPDCHGRRQADRDHQPVEAGPGEARLEVGPCVSIDASCP